MSPCGASTGFSPVSETDEVERVEEDPVYEGLNRGRLGEAATAAISSSSATRGRLRVSVSVRDEVWVLAAATV